MDRIKNYYLLCTVQLGGKQHLVNELSTAQREITYTKKEISLYFREYDGKYVPREIVIGGDELECSQPILIF